MTISRRNFVIAATALAVLLAAILVLVLTTKGHGLGSADRRLVDRHEAALDRCLADDISLTERSVACVESSRIRDDIRARDMCFDLTGEGKGYRDVYRCPR